jgi:hypothetical protein
MLPTPLSIGVPTQVIKHDGIHRVGEKQNRSFQLCFNGFLKVDFQGSRVTSNGGLIPLRELDEHLGMSQLIEHHLTDPRRGKKHAASVSGPVAPVRLQPHGGI